MARSKIWFESGRDRCAAWHYPGGNGACIVMAPGGGVAKEPGTDRFAQRFNAAGFSVLGVRLSPPWRERRRTAASHSDPRSARRPGSRDQHRSRATRSRACSYRAMGLLLVRRAPLRDRRSDVCRGGSRANPTADGLAATPNAFSHETLGVILRMPFLALRDLLRAATGRPPHGPADWTEGHRRNDHHP